MSSSRRDFVRTAGFAAATAAVGGTIACKGSSNGSNGPETTPASLSTDTLKNIKTAILNGHFPAPSDPTMFADDVEHADFLTKLFGNEGNIDDLLKNKVKIADAGQRGAVRGIGARIPKAVALDIYGIIKPDVDKLRANCPSGESHWY